MDIHEIINKIYPMPESSVDKLKRLLSKVTYPKGHLILETGKTETNLFFIEKGIARAYFPVDGLPLFLIKCKEPVRGGSLTLQPNLKYRSL